MQLKQKEFCDNISTYYIRITLCNGQTVCNTESICKEMNYLMYIQTHLIIIFFKSAIKYLNYNLIKNNVRIFIRLSIMIVNAEIINKISVYECVNQSTILYI